MDKSRYRQCLAADFARLRAAAAGLERPVPSCPGWSVVDLVRHVARVYLHKTESMRRGEFPQPWPPDLSGEEPLPLLDRAYAELVAEFDARPAEQATVHWYEPESTVLGLLRRMAQETVIHRVDAELAAGVPVTPIPTDLALDGVDEMLVAFVGFLSRRLTEEFTQLPADGESPPVLVTAGDRGWLVTATPSGVRVSSGGAAEPAAQVRGEPAVVLRWLWGRADDAAVTVTGDLAAVAQLRGLVRDASQ